MTQRPIDVAVQLQARVPRGHAGFWEIIRELKRFTIRDVDRRSNVHLATVRDFVRRLERGGYLRRDAEQTAEGIVYELIRDQPEVPALRRDGTPARQKGLGQEQMWRAMKMLRDFDARDLAFAASTDDEQIRIATAQSYIKHLHRVGYLAVVQPAKTGTAGRPGSGSLARYKLLPSKRTGPLAPMIQRTHFVFDPNLNRVVGEGVPA